jgi:uncharacterized metal-binding protein YceD (DUF177 family)
LIFLNPKFYSLSLQPICQKIALHTTKVMTLKEFDIPIFGLSNKTHHYQFEVMPAFFTNFAKSPVQNAHLKANVKLEKSERMIVLELQANGKVQLICDRSLDEFDYPLDIQEKIYYKYGEEEKEISEELYMIKPATTAINVAQLIYESVCLSIPMKKLHPRFQEESNEIRNNEILVYTTRLEDENTTEDNIDPRWEALKKLKS